MKTSKTTAMIILIIGIGLLAASLLADMIGLGVESSNLDGRSGFGVKQIAGTITGGIIAAVGVYLHAQNKK